MTHPTDQPLLPTRSLAPGQTTQVWVVDLDNGVPELVYSSEELLLQRMLSSSWWRFTSSWH